MELELRNLQNIYYPTEVSYDRHELEMDDEDEEPWYEDVASKIFVDEINGNKIIFTFCSLNGKEEIPEDFVSSICNSIRDSAYTYLINVLNNHVNVTVDWSQVEGTTSDYSILYDGVESEKTDDCCNYKYTERKNGIWSKIKFE